MFIFTNYYPANPGKNTFFDTEKMREIGIEKMPENAVYISATGEFLPLIAENVKYWGKEDQRNYYTVYHSDNYIVFVNKCCTPVDKCSYQRHLSIFMLRKNHTRATIIPGFNRIINSNCVYLDNIDINESLNNIKITIDVRKEDHVGHKEFDTYESTWVQDVDKGPDDSLSFKPFVKNQWKFVKNTCGW